MVKEGDMGWHLVWRKRRRREEEEEEEEEEGEKMWKRDGMLRRERARETGEKEGERREGDGLVFKGCTMGGFFRMEQRINPLFHSYRHGLNRWGSPMDQLGWAGPSLTSSLQIKFCPQNLHS